MTFEPAQIRQRGKKFSGRARPMFPALRWKTRPMATISIGEPESSPSRHEVVDNTALRAAREVAGMAPLRAEAG